MCTIAGEAEGWGAPHSYHFDGLVPWVWCVSIQCQNDTLGDIGSVMFRADRSVRMTAKHTYDQNTYIAYSNKNVSTTIYLLVQ